MDTTNNEISGGLNAILRGVTQGRSNLTNFRGHFTRLVLMNGLSQFGSGSKRSDAAIKEVLRSLVRRVRGVSRPSPASVNEETVQLTKAFFLYSDGRMYLDEVITYPEDLNRRPLRAQYWFDGALQCHLETGRTLTPYATERNYLHTPGFPLELLQISLPQRIQESPPLLPEGSEIEGMSEVDGLSCVTLRWTSSRSGTDTTHQYTVCPDQDFKVVQRESHSGGKEAFNHGNERVVRHDGVEQWGQFRQVGGAWVPSELHRWIYQKDVDFKRPIEIGETLRMDDIEIVENPVETAFIPSYPSGIQVFRKDR